MNSKWGGVYLSHLAHTQEQFLPRRVSHGTRNNCKYLVPKTRTSGSATPDGSETEGNQTSPAGTAGAAPGPARPRSGPRSGSAAAALRNRRGGPEPVTPAEPGSPPAPSARLREPAEETPGGAARPRSGDRGAPCPPSRPSGTGPRGATARGRLPTGARELRQLRGGGGAAPVRRGTGSGEVPLPRPSHTGCARPRSLRACPPFPPPLLLLPARTAAPLTCPRRARPAPPRHRRARPARGLEQGAGPAQSGGRGGAALRLQTPACPAR